MTEVKVYPGNVVDVTGCARCGLTHLGLQMRAFTRQHSNCTHFAMCPRCDEPILFCMLDYQQAQAAREKANN